MPDGWRLAPKAQDDLSDIWNFGAERWSEDQADAYGRDLARLFGTLARHPRIARERPGLPEGVRVHPYRAHMIFYRVDGDGIEILRIGHGRSDWLAAFDE